MSIDDFVCRYAQPFVGCDLPEMLVCGLLLYANGLLCIVFFVMHALRARATRSSILDQTGLFWISLSVWQLFRGTCQTFYFHWNEFTLRLVYIAAAQILCFIANACVILLLFRLLFTFRDPGTTAVGFFQLLFSVSLITFVAICVILGFVVMGEETADADRPTALWAAMTQFVGALFFVLPAQALVRAVIYPTIQKENRTCVSFCRVAVWIYALIFFGRAIFNFTHYCGINALQNTIYRHSWNDPGVRVFNAVFTLVFDIVPASLSIASVYLLRKYDMLFNETAFYASRLS
jgi:hypothetical protein